MSCEKYKNTIVLYLYGELEGKEKNSFEAHLRNCPQCRQELVELQNTAEMVDELPAEQVDRSIVEKVLQKSRKKLSWLNLALKKIQTSLNSSTDYRLPWALAAAAASVILVLSFWNPFTVHRSDETYDLIAWNSGIEQELDHIQWEITEMYSEYEFDGNTHRNIETRIDLIESNMRSLSQDIETMTF